MGRAVPAKGTQPRGAASLMPLAETLVHFSLYNSHVSPLPEITVYVSRSVSARTLVPLSHAEPQRPPVRTLVPPRAPHRHWGQFTAISVYYFPLLRQRQPGRLCRQWHGFSDFGTLGRPLPPSLQRLGLWNPCSPRDSDLWYPLPSAARRSDSDYGTPGDPVTHLRPTGATRGWLPRRFFVASQRISDRTSRPKCDSDFGTPRRWRRSGAV